MRQATTVTRVIRVNQREARRAMTAMRNRTEKCLEKENTSKEEINVTNFKHTKFKLKIFLIVIECP